MNGETKIRSLIVDDEALSRDALRRMLGEYPETELVGECSDGYQAVAAIRSHSPDLVFLDVVMPEINGFAVLESVSRQQRPPCVIIVTAHPEYEYVRQAFEVSAVDFLLKPVDRKCFDVALQRAKKELTAGRSAEMIQRLLALVEKLSAESRYVERLMVKERERERAFYVGTDRIDWIEADGKHVRLHVGRESYELREALCSLADKLNPKKFKRISRFTLVNVDSVKEIVTWIGRDKVVLKDGRELEMSRAYRKNLKDI